MNKMNILSFDPGDVWFITHKLSISGLREFQSENTEDGMLNSDLVWKYNDFPNCRTVR